MSDSISVSAILNLKSKQRDEVLRELVYSVPELQSRPDAQETLLKAVIDRERLHSTGMGDGIALPHSRNALVGLVDRTLVVFGRHAEGVHVGAIDGAPARLFFLLVAPTVTQHLGLLARISRLLRDPKLRQNLLSVPTAEKAVALLRESGL